MIIEKRSSYTGWEPPIDDKSHTYLISGSLMFSLLKKPTRNSQLRFVIGFIISIVCITTLVWKFDWSAFFSALQDINMLMLVTAAILVIASYFVQACRWRVLLTVDCQLSFPRALRFLMIGCLGNVTLPFRAGDVIRAYMVRSTLGYGGIIAFGSIIVERIFDVFAMLIFGSIIGFISELPTNFTSAFIFIAALGTLGGIFVYLVAFWGEKLYALLLRLQRSFQSISIDTLMSMFKQLIDAMRVIVNTMRFLGVSALSIVAWGLIGLAMWFFIEAFGLNLPLAAGGLLMVTTHLGAIIPSAPASIGVYHALAVITLAFWKVDTETAFAIAVISHGIIVGLQIIGGSISAWIEGGIVSNN